MVMLAKGNRSPQVREACANMAAFISARSAARQRGSRKIASEGRAARISRIGMEAMWRIEVENFPAFIVIDDKGNDFFKELNLG